MIVMMMLRKMMLRKTLMMMIGELPPQLQASISDMWHEGRKCPEWKFLQAGHTDREIFGGIANINPSKFCCLWKRPPTDNYRKKVSFEERCDKNIFDIVNVRLRGERFFNHDLENCNCCCF